MRSCLLWLSLLLVVLADRSLASPYFDEGKFADPDRSSFPFLECRRAVAVASPRRNAFRENEVPRDHGRRCRPDDSGNVRRPLTTASRRPVSRFSGSRPRLCAALFRSRLGHFATFMGDVVRMPARRVEGGSVRAVVVRGFLLLVAGARYSR